MVNKSPGKRHNHPQVSLNGHKLRMSPQHRLNMTAGLASIGTALFLVLVKYWAVKTTGSLSIGASLADSLMDLMISLNGLVGILYAAKPPDDDHRFGHTSIEDLIALAQSILVMAVAGYIAWQGWLGFFSPRSLVAESTGIVVMAISILATALLITWQGKVAGETGSKIVAADRLHYLSDLVPAIGAMIALAASSLFGIDWLDPVIALAAAIFLLLNARRIGVAAWHSLMDRRADIDDIETIQNVIEAHPNVLGFHDLKTRTSGSRVFVQLHLELDGALSLNEAHAISASVKHGILDAMPQADVIIHKDPVTP